MIRATWNGAILAESDRTLRVEGNHYFPPDAVRWEYLHPSATHTRCPWKGTASYYNVEVDGKTNRDAAWHYPTPSAAAAEIAGHIAFWHGVHVQRLDDDGDDPLPKRTRAQMFHRDKATPALQRPDQAEAAGVPDGHGDEVTSVTDATFASFSTGRYTAIDFFAPWCAPCQQLGPTFDRAAAQCRTQLGFGRCDIDQNPHTAEALNIVSIPTIIVFDPQGRELDRLVGAPGSRRLDAFLAAIIRGAA